MRSRVEIENKIEELAKEKERINILLKEVQNSEEFHVQEQIIYIEIDLDETQKKIDLLKWVINEEDFPMYPIKDS